MRHGGAHRIAGVLYGRAHASAGMTLIEVLMAATLSLMILGALVILLRDGMRIWRAGQEHATAQQGALLAMHRVSRDLQLSDVKSVLVHGAGASPGKVGLSFLSAEKDSRIQHDEYGRILWQKFAVYYHDLGTRTLRYREEPVATPDTTWPLGEPTHDPESLTLEGPFHPAPEDRVVSANIVGFTPSVNPGSNPVSVEIRAADERDNAATVLRTSVVLENGFLRSHPVAWRLVRNYNLVRFRPVVPTVPNVPIRP